MAKKSGRPSKPYRTSWGEHVVGLRSKGKGRWFIVAAGKEFREADERRAVQRFRRWENQQDGSVVEITGKISDFESPAAYHAAIDAGASLQGQLDGSYRVGLEASAPLLYAWFREQLITRPEHVAQMTGIPELARLADLPKPQPSPRLDGLGELYASKSQISKHEQRSAKTMWIEFVATMKKHDILTLRGITVDAANAYGDSVLAKGKSPTYARRRFSMIKTVINFARKRGNNPRDCRHALDSLAILKPPKKAKTNPHPITRENLHTLLCCANDDMKASLLLGLNLCLYPSELVALNWYDFDLDKKTFRSDRNKTGIVRIGVLWDRTIEALNKIPRRQNDALHISNSGGRLKRDGIAKRWRVLREQADLPNVKFDSLRDGSYTAACEAGVELQQAQALAGHATGIPDHYVLRRPTMVSEACEAIEQYYFS